MEIHEKRCKNLDQCRPVQISCDGLSECRSNSNSLDVYSLKFSKCNTVYPHTIIRPVQKHKVDPNPYFESFIDDILSNHCLIKMFIGDNPKRALARAALNHASSYACEYCTCKATSYQITSEQVQKKTLELKKQVTIIEQRIISLEDQEERDEEEMETLLAIKSGLMISLKEVNKKRKQLVWPSSSRTGGEPRTKENTLQIVNLIEQNVQLTTPDEAKGIVGKWPLLKLENFNFVLDVPTEYLHSFCLGSVKRTVELTFQVSTTTRPRITTRKLTLPSVFNSLICNVKVPCEFPRRVRILDFLVWKGQEFRNLTLFFFPVVIDCLEENAEERRLWLLLAYKLRACVVPDEEFDIVDKSDILYCCAEFYKLYEALFGPRNCTYNTHVVSSHLLEMRVHGPLTLTSAFIFENFYGEIRRSFSPGTVSPLKQIFEKILIKRTIGTHTCKPTMTVTTHETSLECNNLVYTFKDKTHNLYLIKKIHHDELTCVKIKTEEKFFPETPTLSWEKVGVFKEKGITSDHVKINHKEIAGKVIRVKDVLLTCPENVLHEK